MAVHVGTSKVQENGIWVTRVRTSDDARRVNFGPDPFLLFLFRHVKSLVIYQCDEPHEQHTVSLPLVNERRY